MSFELGEDGPSTNDGHEYTNGDTCGRGCHTDGVEHLAFKRYQGLGVRGRGLGVGVGRQ